MAEVKTGRKTRGKSNKKFREERKSIISQLYADLEQWERETAPEIVAELVARFSDGYHGRNPRLIAMQDPDATDVDAHGAWKERGRRVVGKGTGIKIVYPAYTYKVEDPDNPGKFTEHTEYRITNVFDIRHTVEDDPAVIKQWHADHPDGKWE